MSKFLFLVGLIAFASLMSWISYLLYEAYQPKPMQLQGQIDATSYTISSEVAGRVEKLYVKKGDMVTEDDLIFTLYTPRQSSITKNEWLKSKVALELALKTYKRINNLYKSGVLAKQKRDIAYTEYKAAIYNEQMAKKMYESTNDNPKSDKKVNEIVQFSRYSGEVSSVLLHEGEIAPVGFPVVSITDINSSWAKFFVSEDILYKFPKGKEFKMRIPALDNREFLFVVDFISVMGEFATYKAAQSGKN
ncbi:MAG: efflux RND transporter periplasmic adaptor subunit, partial [Campylobacterota bacterium]|nr:efflux RND transporter periplasmic adaptor subunit [Campylobacterota bacterium]